MPFSVGERVLVYGWVGCGYRDAVPGTIVRVWVTGVGEWIYSVILDARPSMTGCVWWRQPAVTLSEPRRLPGCDRRVGAGPDDQRGQAVPHTRTCRVTRRLTLVASPAPTVTFIPAPTLVVRRLANGSEMARLLATSHRLAREVARRWRGRVEVVTAEPRPIPSRRAECRRGHRGRRDAPQS
jgi:hypothetical protein